MKVFQQQEQYSWQGLSDPPCSHTGAAGWPAPVALPLDRDRPPVSSYVRDSMRMEVVPAVAQELRALISKEHVSWRGIFLAAFTTLLFRHTGQSDIIVGTSLENIGSPKQNEPTAVRARLADELMAVELVRQLEATLKDAAGNGTNGDGSPLFNTAFLIVDSTIPAHSDRLSDLAGTGLADCLVQCDLVLGAREQNGGLVLDCEFDVEVFDASTVKRLLEHFRALLAGIASNPAAHLSKLPLLSPAERQKILVEWNQTKTSFPQDLCVHQAFEAQVQRTPDAIAAVFENQQLTYRELNVRTNRLAHHLIGLGVGPDVLAGICVERSLEMLVGLLAILKAGGAYVPLDPSYPRERLGYMLENARVQVLLTQQRLTENLPAHTATMVLLDSDPQKPEPAADQNPTTSVTSDNLAYVLYTSGSTGKPKGVMVTHRNVANFFVGMDRSIGSDPGVWLALTSISFDISVLELFWTLARGFQVVIAGGDRPVVRDRDPAGHANDFSTAGLITRHQITHLQCTPSLASLLMGEPEMRATLAQIRHLLIGGEVLPSALAHQLRAATPATIYNMYGPTETTVWSTTQMVNRVDGPLTIGRPIANTEVYLLDEHLELVPIGMAGELYIGGAGVARGYLNSPELTAEKFIRNPFSPAKRDERIYRTGDFARFLADGTIEFIGRVDHQVKLRGHRIELGEIEAVLNEHPTVGQSVVIAREAEPGDKRLVAYVTPRDRQEPRAAQLRSYLKEKLPEYMVPADIVTLVAFPQTPNRKIDRKALPPPGKAEPETETDSGPPRTNIEKALANLWEEMLDAPQVNRGDDFFGLGGDASLAGRIISKIEQTCQVRLPPNILFESPTLADFAGRLGRLFLEQASLGESAAQAGSIARAETAQADLTARAAHTPVELALAGMWAGLLHREQVKPKDNFFELGGHSLIATQLVSRLRATFKIELPLRALFEAPTVEGLAKALIGLESKPGQVEKIARVLVRLQAMSPGELEAALQAKKRANPAF